MVTVLNLETVATPSRLVFILYMKGLGTLLCSLLSMKSGWSGRYMSSRRLSLAALNNPVSWFNAASRTFRGRGSDCEMGTLNALSDR